MIAERIKMMNIVKTMVNECEKFANSLERYNDLKNEFTNEEWDELIDGFSEKEMKHIDELNERYDYHLERISKLK